MTVTLNAYTWQILRYLVRNKKPALGRDLRLTPRRYNRDGTFLDKLVEDGLIAVADKPGQAPEFPRFEEPVQFVTLYKLTPRGEHAAEYGEYQADYTPSQDAPISGLYAELQISLEAQKRRLARTGR